ncbi:MAG TPA: DNA-3-methyladenine glycosylase I, partial [Flavobacteriales bacterium]|nr:DNA-3-methyladenine glycosylase I [Flavobacteriales bacterium]
MKNRCSWADGSDIYRDYHDKEWGVPAYDDRALFEAIILDTFQAGLS